MPGKLQLSGWSNLLLRRRRGSMAGSHLASSAPGVCVCGVYYICIPPQLPLVGWAATAHILLPQ